VDEQTLHTEERGPADFSILFGSAIIEPAPESPLPLKKFRIAWLLKSLNVDSASIRYRCYHFARALAGEFESEYFTRASELGDRITQFDAVIIVKRIDKDVPSLVAKARFCHIPVFLDLCDDMLAPGYVKNEFGINLVRFLGIAPMLAAVIVPSAEMADRIESYGRNNGYEKLTVRVIPDIAETWNEYRSTAKFATNAELPAKLPSTSAEDPPGLKKVVWFGNFGASHSNFGIFSLKPALKSLRTVNEEIPLELVVVSNNRTVFDALVRDCGFPVRFIEWSPQNAYAQLQSADVALLTSGDDDFCEIKSSCRVLQALAAGVPVISAKGSAVSEFDSVIALGRMQEALRRCLGPFRGRFVPDRLEAARQLLTRFTAKRLGGIWAGILKNAIGQASAEQGEHRDGPLLLLLEKGDDLKSITKLLAKAKRTPGLRYSPLVDIALLEGAPEYGPPLRLSGVIPRFFSGELTGARNLLLGCSALVVERLDAPVAMQLREHAKELRVPVLVRDQLVKKGLEHFVGPRESVVPPKIRAGPYEERSNADGSVDWAFVVHEKGRGWILDAICREIGSRQPDSWRVNYFPEPLPKAKNYFFSHYAVFQPVLERHPEMLEGANIFVWYTHPREEEPTAVANLLLVLEKATKVIFACNGNRQVWLERGLAEDKTTVVLGAASPALFKYHDRGNGVVGLSSSFYERKNPDCLLQLIKLLPHREFLLLGRRWNQYALFEEMRALPNFTYLSAPYRDYPDIYSRFDVFLSMSTLEGGPIPLVEAMMSNAVPVASRTGFAPDLIKEGANGFIFDLDARPVEIAEMIEEAFTITTNVRATVEQYSWENFSAEIMKLAR
jgi:glycosyltransferase involved in cell wall biosynthesis